MSGSPPPPKPAAAPAARTEAITPTNVESRVRGRGIVPMISMALGALVIAGALASLLVGRDAEGETEIVAFAEAFACPPGIESRSGRVKVTASTLNVRAAPSSKADRLPDRTLRKHTAVAEECRGDGWSRVRLVDGRSGWVSSRYLAPLTGVN